MFKPLPQGTAGVLAQSAVSFATTLYVDVGLYLQIYNLLGPADWTYLHIAVGGHYEVVKVEGAGPNNAIFVKRGREGTSRTNILAGAEITYKDTVAGIRDTLSEQLEPITFTGTGVVEAAGSSLYMPNVIVASNGDVEITASTTFWDSNLEACKPYKCPGYVLSPFYLVSRPYAVETMEALAPFQLDVIAAKLREDPRYWEALDPFTLAVFNGTKTGGLKTYIGPPEGVTVAVLEVFDGTKTGGLREIIWPNNDGDPDDPDSLGKNGVELALEVFGGDIYGNAVAYVWPVEGLNLGLEVIDGLLEDA